MQWEEKVRGGRGCAVSECEWTGDGCDMLDSLVAPMPEPKNIKHISSSAPDKSVNGGRFVVSGKLGQ